MKQPEDQQFDLPVIVGAIRQSLLTLLSEHPEGHRAVLTSPRLPHLPGEPPLGLDVWEMREPDGPPERLLVRLVTEEHFVCVFGFDQTSVVRSQAVFGNPAIQADLVVSAIISAVDRGLAE